MESLKKNESFQAVYKNGKSAANKYLVIYVLKNNLNYNRLGISVSKKVGNSIVRHRLTRLIRESYRLNEEKFNSSLNDTYYDFVVIARVNANTVKKCKEIEDAMLNVISKLKIFDI